VPDRARFGGPHVVVSLGISAVTLNWFDLVTAFGHAQQAFMEWFGKIRIWRGLQPDGQLGPDEAIASAWGTAIGAEITGRNKFRPTTGAWPEDGWRGWWGEDPPFHTPCFVMMHYEREPLAVGHTTFHFVSGMGSRLRWAPGPGTRALGADDYPQRQSGDPNLGT
jgi:hypothetical protein